MTKQRKLNTDIGEYNDVGGMTEHEAYFLPPVTAGLKLLDPGFENIYQYERIEPLVENARNIFKKAVVKHIGETDFNRINRGLKAYVRSASSDSDKLAVLKASILNAFGEDLLTGRYESGDTITKQIIKPNYFEKIERYLSIDKIDLIPKTSILYYQKKAVEITKKYYALYLKGLDMPEDIYESTLYSGFGNYHYYEKERKGEEDMLSVYGGLGESTHFYANQLLNSYSINNRVANHFMVMGNNTRRAMFNAELPSIIDDLFSSFFVCKHFNAKQYEFLILPNRREIFLYERMRTELMTDFILSEKPNTFLQDYVLSKEDVLNIADDSCPGCEY